MSTEGQGGGAPGPQLTDTAATKNGTSASPTWPARQVLTATLCVAAFRFRRMRTHTLYKPS